MKRIIKAVVLGLVLATSGALAVDDNDAMTLTATFPRTTSLYEGAMVKVLGVEVGKVEEIEVEGTSVVVTMSYDGVALPADVQALIVPPAIVGDRFVQLAPAYESGPVLKDGAHLDLADTGVPMELDEVYRGLDELTAALGPEGANKDGALSRLIKASATHLRGRGELYNQTIREMAQAVTTLAGSADDMSGTVENLHTVTHTLAGKDVQMRRLVANLAMVATTLNSQTTGIETAVGTLDAALRDVHRFVRRNRLELAGTVSGLANVTSILNRHSRELAYLVDLAPVGLTSFGNIYVPRNWDPARPDLTPPAARVGSIAMRSGALEQLDIQLTSALGALCTSLPADQQVRLASFCTALRSAGSLGALVTQVGRGELSPSATTLEQLIGGDR